MIDESVGDLGGSRVNESQLLEMHPKLYHMAELGSWPSIERHGLLGAAALLDLFEVDADSRESITRQRRPNKIRIEHQDLGSATIRDNKPIHDSLLARCLVGMEKGDWYGLLNSQVFFWLTRQRVDRFMCARSYRHEKHTVITLSTSRLLERQREDVRLSPINSGAIHPGSLSERGPDTFSPIGAYDIEQYSYRPRRERIRELAVIHSVPNVSEIVVDVEDTSCGG